MGGIVAGYGAGEAAVLAFLAGRGHPAAARRSGHRHRRDDGRHRAGALHPGAPRPLGAAGAAAQGEGGALPAAHACRSTRVMDVVGSAAFRDTARAMASPLHRAAQRPRGALDSVRTAPGQPERDHLRRRAQSHCRQRAGERASRARGHDHDVPPLARERPRELRLRAGGHRPRRRWRSSRWRCAHPPAAAPSACPTLLARLADSTARVRPTVFVSLGSPYVGAQVPCAGQLPARLGVEPQHRMGRGRRPFRRCHLGTDARAGTARGSPGRGPKSARADRQTMTRARTR